MLLSLTAMTVLVLGKPCDDDVCRTGPELITSKGFPLERHYVKTEDGYILGMLRLSNPNVSSPTGIAAVPGNGKPAVLLQHGLMDSSDAWIVNYRNSSLAFILADAGFDVWLGNTRGNSYSRNHTKLNPNAPFNREFWTFTYDEMAKFDVPAQVDHVRAVSGQPKISYIGHSQGTTQMFANLAQPQDAGKYSVKDKLASFVALAPVAYIHHCKSFLLQLVSTLHADQLVNLLGMNEFILSREGLEKILPGICKTAPDVCDDVVRAVAGYDPADFDQARWPVYMSHYPSGESTRELEHYAQGIRHEDYKMYDFGREENLKMYNQPTPPVYDVRKITGVAMALFFAENDELADPTDVRRLLTELPKETAQLVVYDPTWGHLDYPWGKNAYKVCYPNVISFIKQHLA